MTDYARGPSCPPIGARQGLLELLRDLFVNLFASRAHRFLDANITLEEAVEVRPHLGLSYGVGTGHW